MPNSRLTRSKAFLLLLIAMLQLAWTPGTRACVVADMAPQSCCVELSPTTCCDEPETPPEDSPCPCATHPGPSPAAPKAFLVDGGFSSLEPWAVVPVARVTPRADRDVRAIPPVGMGPPVYRLHCVLLI